MPENALCYVPFNISEHQKIACTAVGGRSCSEFAKTGEGPYYAHEHFPSVLS